MDRDQLRTRHTAALSRHWRTSLDRGGPTPELLDDLAAIADEYAGSLNRAANEGMVPSAATTLRDDYGHGDGGSTGTTPLVAADPEVPPGVPPTMPPAGAPPRPRTRARTRGGSAK